MNTNSEPTIEELPSPSSSSSGLRRVPSIEEIDDGGGSDLRRQLQLLRSSPPSSVGVPRRGDGDIVSRLTAAGGSKRKREDPPIKKKRRRRRPSTAIVVAVSREEREKRDKRKREINEFYKTWLRAKRNEVKEQRSSAVRNEILEQERRALLACIHRVNTTQHGFCDTHTILALLRALMCMYHREGKEDVATIPTLRVDRSRVLAKGRQGFLRELYVMLKDRSETWEWPEECNTIFQRELEKYFEDIERGGVTDRDAMARTIAQQMAKCRERIDREYKERISVAVPRAVSSYQRGMPLQTPPPHPQHQQQQFTYQRVITFTQLVCSVTVTRG